MCCKLLPLSGSDVRLHALCLPDNDRMHWLFLDITVLTWLELWTGTVVDTTSTSFTTAAVRCDLAMLELCPETCQRSSWKPSQCLCDADLSKCCLYVQLLNNLFAEHVWTHLTTKKTHFIGKVNPHNRLIVDIFGDQGGHWCFSALIWYSETPYENLLLRRTLLIVIITKKPVLICSVFFYVVNRASFFAAP